MSDYLTNRDIIKHIANTSDGNEANRARIRIRQGPHFMNKVCRLMYSVNSATRTRGRKQRN